MVESAINRHRSGNSPRLNCNFPMYWFVLFHGARTARNVLLAATSFEFQASHCRYFISISFSGIISVANYLLARTKSFDREHLTFAAQLKIGVRSQESGARRKEEEGRRKEPEEVFLQI
jgi:hypothetical protein